MARPDRATLCAWFAGHGRGLVLFARQALPPEHRAAAEDVVQEVFVRLLAKTGGPEAASNQDATGGPDGPDHGAGVTGPAADGMPNPAAWLYRCVRNACEDERRSRVRRARRERAVAAGRTDWFDPRPGDRIDARAAQAALETLPDLARQIVVLRVWSGLTLAETAEVVGVPVSTAHDHYRRALSTLRVAIGRTPEAAPRPGPTRDDRLAWSL